MIERILIVNLSLMTKLSDALNSTHDNQSKNTAAYRTKRTQFTGSCKTLKVNKKTAPTF